MVSLAVCSEIPKRPPLALSGNQPNLLRAERVCEGLVTKRPLGLRRCQSPLCLCVSEVCACFVRYSHGFAQPDVLHGHVWPLKPGKPCRVEVVSVLVLLTLILDTRQRGVLRCCPKLRIFGVEIRSVVLSVCSSVGFLSLLLVTDGSDLDVVVWFPIVGQLLVAEQAAGGAASDDVHAECFRKCLINSRSE